ncbi:MAG: hypothetical protein AB9858_05050 [Acidaminococcaceae bacterium]
MYRYAQILNNKVHWIFEEEMTLKELGQHKFNLSQIKLVDITNVADVQEGYAYDGANFTNPNIETLDEAKIRYTKAAGSEFACRRDVITWTQHEVGLYGYDRKPEDVSNFLAAMKRSELGLETGFNVYVGGVGPKQFLSHTYEMFKVVLEQSANEQISAYQWYEGVKSQLQVATSIEELEQIYPLGGE